MQNICFVGRMGSGKTTLAEYLVSELGYVRYSLATPVKEAASVVYGVMQNFADVGNDERIKLTPEEINKNKQKYRKLLQVTGTELGRDLFHQDVWVNQLIKIIDIEPNPVVVDDVRFRNELATLVNKGFYPIYLTRSEAAGEETHSSEQLTKKEFIDFMINLGYNEGAGFALVSNTEDTTDFVFGTIKRIAESTR